MNMEDLYRLLRTGHVQLQGIVDTIGEPLLVLDAGLCVQNASRSFFETFKVDRYETIGRPLHELGNGQWDIPDLRRLLQEVIPKATAVINYQVEHDFPDLGRRTMLVTARTLHHPDGGSHSMLVSIVDVTESQRRGAAKDMLFLELRHRVKNLLSLAQSLARQTTTEGRSAEEYRDAFLGRFDALMEAQDLAFAEQGETGVQEIIERVVSPHAGDRAAVVIEPGTPVELAPRVVQSLALVLHELATNAVKHGALSAPGGRVRLSWMITPDGQLCLKWVERGGPPVSAPSKGGFGTQLINSATTYALGGQTKQDYKEDGLEAEIVIPLGKASPPIES